MEGNNPAQTKFELLFPFPPANDEVTLAEADFQMLTLSGSNNTHNVQILDKYRRVNGVVYPFVSCASFGEQESLNRTKIIDERATFSAKPNKARKTFEIESVSPWNSFLDRILSNPLINIFAYLSGYSNNIDINKLNNKERNIQGNIIKSKETRKLEAEKIKVKEVKMHANKQILAVAFSDDNIYFYDLQSEIWKITEQGNSFVLIHEFQKEVETIEWIPCSSFSLAVGCKYGICIWSIVFSANSIQGSVNSGNITNSSSSQSIQIVNMRFLSFPSFLYVSSLSCSPDGKFLSSSSLHDNGLIVWDLSTLSPSVIRRGFTKGIKKQRYSFDGSYLAVIYSDNSLRIFETLTFTSQSFQFKGNVKGICWMNDSRNLFIGVSLSSSSNKKSSAIYCIRLDSDPPLVRGKVIQESTEYLPSYSVKLKANFPNGEEEEETTEEVNIGGEIENIEIDPSGNRLAVSFEGNQPGSNLIILYSVQSQRSFRSFSSKQPRSVGRYNTDSSKLGLEAISLTPRGFIKGFAEDYGLVETRTKPSHFTFANNFPRGALLIVSWSDGRISFYPLYFSG